ncbi:DegV family protein [Parabacteroides distasonis]|nr:DegV family protein [Parabacteroides distasonis]
MVKKEIQNDKIFNYSGSDCNKEQLQEKGIEYIPIAISIGDKSFRDGEISKDEFYKLTQESEEFPKTAQPSPQDFIDIFEKIKADGDELICILLSSGLSGLIQSATLAKNMVEYDKIHIVDSLSATFVIKVLVDYGIQLRDSGKTAEEIVAAIKEIQPKVRMYAVLDTLDNLYKGGRLSKIEVHWIICIKVVACQKSKQELAQLQK